MSYNYGIQCSTNTPNKMYFHYDVVGIIRKTVGGRKTKK